MKTAKQLNENLLPVRCYYCNRFISTEFFLNASVEQINNLSEELKMCCKTLITARRP